MAKDTEKLIRQLSLISYLMAERRPVTALEIRRDVEGYSGMNEDAFARRFYADRSELEALRIQLTVERPADGAAEQENYSLRPENFHLPPIAFTDKELAALQTALSLLDGEFAYAEPLRLALQQITWGRPSPLRAPEQRSVALGITASAGGHELSARLAKVETAIFRNKTIMFSYYTMERDEVGPRRVDPYHLLFQGGEFYLLGYAHERKAIRVFRLSRIRGKVSYATKAEHDFRRPADFDPRAYANRADWQLGEQRGTAEILISERIAWQIARHYGRYGEIRRLTDDPTLEGAPARRRARPRPSPQSPRTARRRPGATGSSSPATRACAASSRGCSASAPTPACLARRTWAASCSCGSSCSPSVTARPHRSRSIKARPASAPRSPRARGHPEARPSGRPRRSDHPAHRAGAGVRLRATKTKRPPTGPRRRSGPSASRAS